MLKYAKIEELRAAGDISVESFCQGHPDQHRYRVAAIGTYPPRRCGIATFTSDLVDSLKAADPGMSIDIFAMDSPGAPQRYGSEVCMAIGEGASEDFEAAANRINASGTDAVWIQHEYGIFGGEDGNYICNLVDRVAAPVILTLHTVLRDPTPGQRSVLQHLIDRASAVIVMSREARDLLASLYDARNVTVIPHGVPDRPFGREPAAKACLGLADRRVLMTFGLLGSGKGIEQVIEAMPAILARHPNTVYRIVGATHPALVAREGEAYRHALQALAQRLGVADHIQWDDRFLETDELLDQLEACDIFLTPYPNLQQSTSGTLSYAVALGKAVVSTPFSHARELLADGVGTLVEPGSANAIAQAVIDLLADATTLETIKRRAYAKGRDAIWPRVAEMAQAVLRVAAPPAKPLQVVPGKKPALAGVFAMSDSTGIYQHSLGIVPDRRHGYCLDDNARALMLMNVARDLPAGERLRWSMTYASFIAHAWNEEERCFRNFMGFDRRWLEERGSADSNGRTLWALGHTAECAPDADIREWAVEMFLRSRRCVSSESPLRTLCFAMLGEAALLRAGVPHQQAGDLLDQGGPVLMAMLERTRRPEWVWFEPALAYDNPRICEALIEAGLAHQRADWVQAALEALDWLMRCQTSSRGHFRPVGSETFGKPATVLPFDQQPLEAWAAVDAARTAYFIGEDAKWIRSARTTFAWFEGANDRNVALGDAASGRCRDGVTPRGVNRNCGAESVLAYHLASRALSDLIATVEGRNLAGRTSTEPASYQRH